MICSEFIRRLNQITNQSSKRQRIHGRKTLHLPSINFVKTVTKNLQKPTTIDYHGEKLYFLPLCLETTHKPPRQPKITVVNGKRVPKNNIVRLYINKVNSDNCYLHKTMKQVENDVRNRLEEFDLESETLEFYSQAWRKKRHQDVMEVPDDQPITEGLKLMVWIMVDDHNNVLKIFQNLVKLRDENFPWRIYLSHPRKQVLYVKNCFKSMLAHWLTNLEFDKV